MERYVCIDIGGTSIKFGVIEGNGELVVRGEMDTEAMRGKGPGIMRKAKGIVSGYLEEYEPAGICVSTAGMVDCESGKITHAAPLIPNYTGTEIKKILEAQFHIPCEVENDVNCAGLAEYYAGAARESSICVCLTIGTGIGGAIIMDGQVFHGFSGSGCEIGYMHLPGGEFQDLGASSILVKKTAGYKKVSPESIDGRYIFEQAKSGDKDCIRAIDEMADVLGMGIANICYIINPEVVVLGGGIMAQSEYLLDRIRKSLDQYLLPSVAQNTRLAAAENGNQAGMLGAFYHYRNRRGL